MYRIFIIEDDPTIAQTLKKHLEGWDYKVECAKDFHNITAEFAAFDPQLVPVSYTHLTLPTNSLV